MDIKNKTAIEIGRLIAEKEIGCVEITKHVLENIEKAEPAINAYSFVAYDEAVKQAEHVQTKIDAGEQLSPLAGVPMGIKDNICTKGIVTSCGSKMLDNFIPTYNATVVDRLSDAGAVILGKTNMDEFAMGGSTETSYYGATKNPWDTKRVPGGSSGGSAAVVAANEAVYSIGSDTGGSIRQPCSFCGVSGIKPTYGSVSRFGLVAFASSLDQIGPIGRTVEDCAHVFSIIEGHDKKDSTSVSRPKMDFSNVFDGDVKGIKIGIPRNYFDVGIDEDVKVPVLDAAKKLESLGAIVEEFDMPIVEYAVPTYYVLACAEASSNLSRYDGVKYGHRSENAKSLEEVYYKSRNEGFGMEVKRRIMLGSFVLSSGYYDAYYKKGLQVRGLIQKSFNDAFDKYDMILSPNAPTVAYKLGENNTDPLKMYLGDIYTVSVNLAGVPAVTVPCGFGAHGMPVGLQLIGRPFGEPTLVRAAHAFQMNTDFHLKRSPIYKGGNL